MADYTSSHAGAVIDSAVTKASKLATIVAGDALKISRVKSDESGMEFVAFDIVNDTTPQLGGNLDMNGKDIQTVTPTEMAYVHGVTSSIQTQFAAKQATITGAASTVVTANLTADKIVITTGTGKLGESAEPSSRLLERGAKGFAKVNSAGALVAGFNASSSRNSTGNYTVTWGDDFSTTNYSAFVSLFGGNGFIEVGSQTAGAANVLTYETTGSLADKAFNIIAVEV
ncbi:MAG TPA: hypothetical protein VGD14_09515 [bacterium]